MMTQTILPPHTYAEWVEILNLLQNKIDDQQVLQAMYAGTVQWQSGVAERFSRKLIDVVNRRMNEATDKFQKEIARSGGQERATVQALLALRKEMSFLSNVINLPALPEKERQQYHQLVIDQANSIQKSLEDSAKKERTGKLMSIVRNNRVNAF